MSTLCIVGHGPSLGGAGRGPEIDGFDAVARCVNCDWQSEEDYGRRYQIGLVCGPSRRAVFELGNTRRQPPEWWLYDPRGEWRGQATAAIGGVVAQVYEAEAWRKRAVELGASCRRGAIALLHGFVACAHAAASGRWRRIVLAGHDTLVSGIETGRWYPPALEAAYRPDHPNHALKADGLPAHGHNWAHDFAVEAELVRVLARETGVEIVPLCHGLRQ